MEAASTASLGDLIATFYEEFLSMYGDPELASVATAAVINDMLLDREVVPAAREEAA